MTGATTCAWTTPSTWSPAASVVRGRARWSPHCRARLPRGGAVVARRTASFSLVAEHQQQQQQQQQEGQHAADAAPEPAPAYGGPGVTDLYTTFWEHAEETLRRRLGDALQPYPIPDGFARKQGVTGKGRRAQRVLTRSHAYCAPPQLRQIRAARVQGGAALQVLNFVMFPHLNYDLPFFGADLVTLPGGHLIALDMQPLFHTDAYLAKYYEARLKPVHEKYRHRLEWGGDFPAEAAQFFSPCFLWTRPSQNETVQSEVFGAFRDYLEVYLDLVRGAEPVTEPARLGAIRESHLAYLRYRAEKDPARGMFQRFYGREWTEEYIHGFLFDLERMLDTGRYRVPEQAGPGAARTRP